MKNFNIAPALELFDQRYPNIKTDILFFNTISEVDANYARNCLFSDVHTDARGHSSNHFEYAELLKLNAGLIEKARVGIMTAYDAEQLAETQYFQEAGRTLENIDALAQVYLDAAATLADLFKALKIEILLAIKPIAPLDFDFDFDLSTETM